MKKSQADEVVAGLLGFVLGIASSLLVMWFVLSTSVR